MKKQKNWLWQLAEKLFLTMLLFIGAQATAYAICSPTVSPNPVTIGQSVTFTANCGPVDQPTFWSVFGQNFNADSNGNLTIPSVPATASGNINATIFTAQNTSYFTTFSVSTAAITVSPTSFSFSDTAIGSQQTKVFIVTNSSAGSVSANIFMVLNGLPSGTVAGDFSESNTCNGLIASGGQCNITVTYAPTTTGTSNAGLQINDGVTGSALQGVPLSGSGIGLQGNLFVNPTPYTYPDTVVGLQQQTNAFTVTNGGQGTAVFTDATIVGTNATDFSQTNNCPAFITSGSSCTINVLFKPQGLGNRIARVDLVASNIMTSFPININGNGTALCSPTVTPTSVVAGSNVTLIANCTARPGITESYNWNIAGQTFTTANPIATYTVLANTAPGTNPIALTMSGPTVTYGGPNLTVTAPAVGNFQVTPTTTPYAFPDTQVGLQQTNAFTVTNNGTVAATVTNVTIAGINAADFTQTNNCTGAIAPSLSCNINVVFKPNVLGNRLAQVVIAASNNSLATINVSLTGNGTALCTPTLTPSSIPAGGNITLNAGCTAIPNVTASYTWTILGQTITTTNAALPFAVPATTALSTTAVSVTTNGQPLTYPAATDLTVTAALPGNLVASVNQFVYSNTQVGLQLSNTYTLTNNGGSPVTFTGVTSVGTNAGDFIVSTNTCTGGLPVAANCSFLLLFKPTALGSRAAQITIAATNSATQPTINVSGSGTALCAPTVTPSSIPAGGNVTLNAGCTAIPNVTASYTWTILGQTITTTNAALPFTVPATTAPATAPINVTTNGQTLSYPTATALTVTTPLVGNLVVSPTPFAYPDTQLGAQQTNTFTVTNNGTAAATITGITVTGANAAEFTQTNNCTAAMGPTATCTVNVIFKPTVLGNRVAQVVIAATNSTTQPTIALSGNGIAVPIPVVTLSAASIAFSNVTVGSSNTQTITVQNTGTANLVISGVAITGTDFTQTNNCTAAVTPTNSCTITAVFSPTAAVARSGTITITDNAGGSPRAISLTGTGTAAPVAIATLSKTSIAFTATTIGVTNPQTFTLQNTGTADLVISGIAASGTDFTQTNNCPAALAPTLTCTITVVFKPTAAVARTGAITITDNAGGSPRQITLAGTGTAVPVPVVTLSATNIAYPNVTVGSSNTQTVAVQNTGTANLVISSIAITGTDFTQTNNCPAAVTPTNSCTITAVFSPTAAVARSGTITITDNAGGSPRAISLTGTGTAVPVPVATLSSTNVAFPSTTVNGSNTQTITVQNTGTASLVISGVAITGTDFTQTNNCPAAVTPTNSCTITAVFSPTAAVARSGTITITDNAGGSPRQITLTGTGTAVPVPVVTLSATNIAYPNVTVGGSNTQTVTVQNTGTANLVISGVAITGTDFTQTNNCTAAVTPTNSCTITAVFSPTAAVARSGTITITDNAGGSPRQITLTGTGAAVVVPPSASPFGPDRTVALPSANVGQESQVTINLSNGATTPVGFKGANFRSANTVDFLTTNNCPATLQPAQVCQLNIVFKPLAAGTRTVLLDLADDVTGVSDTVLTLSAVGAVSLLTPAQITQIAAQQIASTLRSTQAGIQSQLTNINRRIRYLRFQDGTPGFQQEINVSANGKGGPLSSAGGGGGCGASGAQGGASSNQGCDEDFAATRSRRWGTYVVGSLGVSEDKLGGVQINTNGITVGSDYRLGAKSALGAAFGTMQSSTTMSGDAGKQDASGYSFVAYASFAPSQTTYIDFALTTGKNKFDLQRTEATGTTAVANTKGSGLGMSLTAGYDWRSGGWAFTPYGRIEYLKAQVKGFNERGTEPIAVGDQSTTSNMTTLGTELQYTNSTSWGVFVPHLRVEFQNQSQSADEGKAQAVGSSVQLTVTPELNKDKSFANVSIGASAQFGKGKTGFVDVEKTIGKENFKDQRITSGFKVEF
jgi:uncharacterized protein YhjY with autotransporter beta-barrel domain